MSTNQNEPQEHEQQPIRCTRCGQTNAKERQTCWNCGGSLVSGLPSQPPPIQDVRIVKQGMSCWGWGCLILILIIFVPIFITIAFWGAGPGSMEESIKPGEHVKKLEMQIHQPELK